MELTAPRWWAALKSASLLRALTSAWQSSKTPRDRDVVDVGVLEGVHLRPLHRAHATGRREHEDADAFLPSEGVLGRRTGVARGGTQDVEDLAPLGQHVGNRLPQELHGQVLESHGRPLGQAHEDQAVGDVVELGHRNDRLREAGLAVGCQGQSRQVLTGNVSGEQADDLGGQFRVVEGSPGLELLRGESGQPLRYRQAAVGCQTRQENVHEPGGCHLSAGGDVLSVLHVPPSCRVACHDATAIPERFYGAVARGDRRAQPGAASHQTTRGRRRSHPPLRERR